MTGPTIIDARVWESEHFVATINRSGLGYSDGTGGQADIVTTLRPSAFGIATFLFLSSRKKIKWIWVMFIWATIFSYTRLYLGVHYPLDIICGGILGAVLAFSVYKTARVIPGKLHLS